MPTFEELRQTRIDKLKKLKTAGVLAYPAKTNRDHTIAEALSYFGRFFKTKKTAVLRLSPVFFTLRQM